MAKKVLFVGHSLVGTTMPQMLNILLADRATGIRADAQVINGAPLLYQWQNGATAQGVNARAVLPSGNYNTLILTEAIPLATHLRWSDTAGMARNYYRLAVAADPATRVMIYETWHEMQTEASWRAALTTNLTLWQGIANSLNATKAATQPAVTLLPAGQAMARLYDTIAQGNGAGLTSIKQLFADTIHLNDIGNHFIALVQFSGITRSSGVGLTDTFTGQFGQSYGGWTEHQTKLFQHVAWEAVARAPGAVLASGQVMPRLVLGGGAAETLTASAGDDRVYGGAGNDVINGGLGKDLLEGGLGNDKIFGSDGHDWMSGATGFDQIFGGNGNDRMFGGDGTDILSGGHHNDYLAAGNGNDVLIGGGGADALFGSAGRDVLNGGAGNDVLVGGKNADQFVFARGFDADRIADFKALDGDMLRLDNALWAGVLSNAQIVQRFAHVTAAGVVFDFGSGDMLTLQGVHTLDGLASHINLF